MSRPWVSVEEAVESVARGEVEVRMIWCDRAADVDSASALKAAIAESETFRELHVRVKYEGAAAVELIYSRRCSI